MSTYFSQAAHAFLIGHEIGHSLLQHTSFQNLYDELVAVYFEDVLKSSHSHQREFQSDIFSIFLITGSFKEEKPFHTFPFHTFPFHNSTHALVYCNTNILTIIGFHI